MGAHLDSAFIPTEYRNATLALAIPMVGTLLQATHAFEAALHFVQAVVAPFPCPSLRGLYERITHTVVGEVDAHGAIAVGRRRLPLCPVLVPAGPAERETTAV
jgi:hypothetical protein